ncbi:MAG: GNAT family N-acetyltransferase [Planctomycetes bacterium]|nr:GNAT family N-acetyltransferase [Planctomycetota bacterium]
MIRIDSLEPSETREWNGELTAFERQFRYPLGDDYFRIDHGTRYLAFFEILGVPRLFVAMDDERLVGVLVAVRRELEIHGRSHVADYLGDLKVVADRKQGITSRRLLRAYDETSRNSCAYGVSMDPHSGPNRVAHALASLPDVEVAARLALFSLDFDAITRIEAECIRALGKVLWIDHAGRKDIVLERTGRPMPLLHLRRGSGSRGDAGGPRPGHVHMICLPDSHTFVTRLRALGFEPATASVLARNCPWDDWSFVSSSDI